VAAGAGAAGAGAACERVSGRGRGV
jgi:hypothetical protein